MVERRADLGSAVLAALGGAATALAFVGLWAALSMPVLQVLNRYI